MGDGNMKKCAISVFVIFLTVSFAGCGGQQDTEERIEISGVLIHHPDLMDCLSEEFIEEYQIRPHPQLALFIPGPDEEVQRIVKVYYNFQGPWVVNGTFIVTGHPDDSYNLKNWAISPRVDYGKEVIKGMSEYDNVVANLSSVSTIIGNHTFGSATDQEVQFLALDKVHTFWNEVRIKGVALDVETFLNWSIFKFDIAVSWDTHASSLVPFDVGDLQERIILAESVWTVDPETMVEGEVLAHFTPLNHASERLRIDNTTIDSEGTRFMVDMVAQVDEQLVVLETDNGSGNKYDVWWILLPYGTGPPGFQGTLTINVTEANITRFSDSVGFEFIGTPVIKPHVGVAYDNDIR